MGNANGGGGGWLTADSPDGGGVTSLVLKFWEASRESLEKEREMAN